MIKIQGALRVKKILQSRNDPFVVGTLSTEIGDFKVKDPLTAIGATCIAGPIVIAILKALKLL